MINQKIKQSAMADGDFDPQHSILLLDSDI